MIEVNHLTKQYGKHLAVNNISFTVKKGEILGFLGPNGAGKSTTMNMLTGYLSSTSGTIKIDNVDILQNPLEAKKHIGYLPETPPLYMDMTVKDYLTFVAKLKKVPSKTIPAHLKEIMALVKIEQVERRLIKNLSKGYKQRIGLAEALVGSPQVLILDEPTVGLDPKQIIEIRSLVKDLSKNHTVILSSHILSEVSAVCDRVMILNKGTIVASDTPENLGHLLAGSSKLTIRVHNWEENFLETLKSLPNIENLLLDKSREKNTMDILIEVKNNADVREEIFNLCYEMYNPILMMKPLDISLEDIFLQITEVDPVSADPEKNETEKTQADSEKQIKEDELLNKNNEKAGDEVDSNPQQRI